ncbi:MAG: M23 family metallopeptidase [Oscillospiraceae bacterium]|nr:M23 family metallopeptidase [Oscillospiraceae bacterium]
MQFENETNRGRLRLPKIPKGGGFYLALTLAVIAAGAGVWGSVNSTLRHNPYLAQSTERSTINWENYATRPLPETQAANDPAKNVPDTRGSAATKPTTTKPAATKPENAPYTGNFVLPFGTAIEKDYSDGEMVKSSTMGDWRVHNGVDFAGDLDSPVVAIQSGTIKKVAIDPLWGIVVTIDHGAGVVARYCGLSEGSTPKYGQWVDQGESIGVIAQVPCESAEGTHLHMEITVDGKIVDPLAVMNRG